MAQEQLPKTTQTIFSMPREMLFFCHQMLYLDRQWCIFCRENIIAVVTQKAKASLFEGDPFDPLAFTEECDTEVNVRDIRGSQEEIVVRDRNLQRTSLSGNNPE